MDRLLSPAISSSPTYPAGARVLDVGFGDGEQMRAAGRRSAAAPSESSTTAKLAAQGRARPGGLPGHGRTAADRGRRRSTDSSARWSSRIPTKPGPSTRSPACCVRAASRASRITASATRCATCSTDRNWKRRVYGARDRQHARLPAHRPPPARFLGRHGQPEPAPAAALLPARRARAGRRASLAPTSPARQCSSTTRSGESRNLEIGTSR